MSRLAEALSPLRRTDTARQRPIVWDYWLLGAALTLLGLGLVMVCSASVSIADKHLDQPFYYLLRQTVYVAIGLLAGAAALRLPLEVWERGGPTLLAVGGLLLVAVLVPGIGREVNGSSRWIGFGAANLQPSELMKLFVPVYLAGYIVRHQYEVMTAISGFLKPLALLVIIAALLLLEPDFGAAAVLLATALGMMFLGGVRLLPFGVLFLIALAGLGLLAVSSPYRLARLTAFLDPWADPFNSGFQLTQALIAFGRGEWFGVGLGNSIQKLFYLPEAHTDFVLAVLAEELGLTGVVVVVVLFSIIVWRAFTIARLAERAGQLFAAYLAGGLGLWLGLQSYINIGVNMGLLPTKGLTLPLMSYGGSSTVVICVAIALLLRIYHEVGSGPQARSGGRR